MSPQSRPSPATLAGVAPVFTALGDETRLHLVSRLCQEGPLSITRLAEGTALTRQAVTKPRRVLGDAGLASSRRHGREQQWHIEARRLTEVRRLLALVSAQWGDALGRLATFVERDRQ
ncbi:MAG: helix-turn-helix transcriptional regulator [Acidobacteria bacterium]|nr:helix-turn-helix transcriptional regulator [Acidobacteriota bacterium]